MISLKAFSDDLCKNANNGLDRIGTPWKTRSTSASSQFKMTVLSVVTAFLYRERTQTIVRQKVYWQPHALWIASIRHTCIYSVNKTNKKLKKTYNSIHLSGAPLNFCHTCQVIMNTVWEEKRIEFVKHSFGFGAFGSEPEEHTKKM